MDNGAVGVGAGTNGLGKGADGFGAGLAGEGTGATGAGFGAGLDGLDGSHPGHIMSIVQVYLTAKIIPNGSSPVQQIQLLMSNGF